MKKAKPYSKYKDSEQEWLGNLPKHWKVQRTKHLFDLITEPAPVGNSMELLSIYTALGVKPRKELEERGNKASTTDGYWIVQKGDIIVNKLLAWMGAIGISEYDGVTSPAYDLLRAKKDVNPYFYNYLFRNPIASREFKRHSRGIMDMRLRLYFTRFGDIKLPLPSIEEQDNIVAFLDYKLEKINRFISKKKQLIELLNEQKAAIINQAVTKGLDPDVKMKDSGIEWLGEIPEHWEVVRMKYLGEAIIGLTYSPSEMVDEENGTLVLRSSNVQNGKITYDDCVYVTTDIPDKKRTRVGDILICSRNGSIKLVGKNALIDERASNQSFGAFMTIFRSNNFEYLHYFFNSASFKAQSGLFFTSTINQLTTGILNNIIVSMPKNIDEQLQIVRFIQEESKPIEKTISTIEKEITLVEEYKTALIAEAVTGKIDVRDFKVPKAEKVLSMAAESQTNYK